VDSSGVAHLVWKDSGRIGARPIDSDFIYRTWNGDGEAGLGEPQTVSVGVNLDCDEFSDCARVHDAAVALSGDVPTVAFSAGGTARKFEVFYATATNGSWSAAQVSDGSFDVPAYAGIGAHSPDMATDFLGNTYLVWVNQITETNSELQFRSVGDSLGRLNRIENDCSTNRVFNPSVAVDEAGAGHLVWAAPSGCGGPSTVSNIYYTTIEGDGVVQAAAVVSSDEGLQGVQNASPEVMVTDRDGESVVAVVWTSSATINGSGTDYDILMKTFGESGDSIPSRVVSEPDSMVNVSAYASYSPTLVSGDAGTLVCWQEKDGNEMADFDVSCTGMGW
jgi:hypothetical protein